MKLMLLYFILSFSIANAATDLPNCKEYKLSLIGFYGDKGQHLSPLLETWSEESGNLHALKVKSKDPFIKLMYEFFENDEHLLDSIELKLTNNKSSSFNLIQFLSILKNRPKIAKIKVFDKFNKPYCQFEQKIIEVDGQDGVLKNVK